MTDSPKLFHALLNGVFKRVFLNDDSITPEFLKEQIFSNVEVSVEEVTALATFAPRS